MANIKDVAQAAGLSFKTVSRVLNNDPTVSEANRERVMKAVAELDYRPHHGARLMRTQRSQIIGLITDQIVTTPYAVKIIKGAQDEAWAQGKVLLILNTEGDRKQETAAIEMMLERRVESILYAASYHRVVDPTENIREVPAILVDCYCEDRSLPSVVPDEVYGGRTAIEKLIEKGHERIAVLNMSAGQAATLGRLEGYKQALEAHQLTFDPLLIREGNWRPDQAYENTISVMNLPHPPTAIFCSNDWSAIGVYDALKEMGLSIPSDVAVIGFDNEEIIAAYLRPALSTMALPHYEMGQWAIRYLCNPSEEHLNTPPQVKLRCPYVERASV